MLKKLLGKKAKNILEGRSLAVEALKDGRGWERFRTLVSIQGGDVRFVDEPNRLPVAPLIKAYSAPRSGYLSWIDARIIGETSVDLGAGRAKKEDIIDPAVGIIVLHKVGDFVEAGQPLYSIHANSVEKLDYAAERVLNAHQWSNTTVQPLPLFYEIVTK